MAVARSKRSRKKTTPAKSATSRKRTPKTSQGKDDLLVDKLKAGGAEKLPTTSKKKPAKTASAKAEKPPKDLDLGIPEGLHLEEDDKGNKVLMYNSDAIKTLDELLEAAEVDLSVWEVERYVDNTWTNSMKGPGNLPMQVPNWQVKAWLKPREASAVAAETILDELARKAPVVPRIKRPPLKKSQSKRALEIAIADPHLGLHCFQPQSDQVWTMDDCESMVMWAIDALIKQAEPYAPFAEVVMPIGNDYLHSDNVFHTTTKGTPQPESMSYHEAYLRGEKLLIAMIERVKEVAPVHLLQIPGNHDRQSSFTLGRVVNAWYRNDKNVTIDASASPYKFWHFGCNLVGYDHGHSIKPLTLATLMANEQPGAWAATAGGYREWHLADQHRKGVMEEQGVSIEWCPSLVPGNEWHKLKGFNWQKRGAMAWLWDFARGPLARLQVSLNSYTGKPMGEPAGVLVP